MILNKDEYAPVFIPTLCRYEHFRRCVDSLSKCTGAENTVIFIGLDFPLKEDHKKGYEKIKEYIPTIHGFKDVIVFERSENYGALKNIQEAQKYIFDRYEICIYTEDDNEFSPNFLEYINKGLIKFKDDPRVIAICGYVYPDGWSYSNSNVFWGIGYSAWGVGEWKCKKLKIQDVDIFNDLEIILRSWRKSLKIYRYRAKLLNSLLTMYKSKYVWGDIMISAICVLENKGSIFPIISKVRNWGDDGSGLHCIHNEGLSKQNIDNSSSFNYDSAINNNAICFSKHKLKFPIKLLVLLRYIIFRMTNRDILSFRYKKREL